MKTRNQIRKILNDYANSHLQIKTFGYGQEFEQQAVEGIEYPLLWVVPLETPVNGADLDRRYRLIIADRVRKDESDEIEVDSDTELILLDSLSYLWKYAEQNNLRLVDSQVLTPFWEKWTDEVSGVYADITLRDYFDWDSCTLPIEGDIPSVGGVTLNVNSTSFATILNNSIYNLSVIDTNSDAVGEKIGTNWVVPAAGDGATPEQLLEYVNLFG